MASTGSKLQGNRLPMAYHMTRGELELSEQIDVLIRNNKIIAEELARINGLLREILSSLPVCDRG